MSFGRRPACDASVAINTQSPCIEVRTYIREVFKILLGSIRARVLGEFHEAFVGDGFVSAPLVRGSVFASLDALSHCAVASLFPRNGVRRYSGYLTWIYWDKGQVANQGVGAILSGFVIAVFASSGVSMHCSIMPRGR